MAHTHDQKVPRGVLVAAAALMAATVGLAALGRARATTEETDAPHAGVELRFEDRSTGEVAVLDHESGREVWLVPSESGGFVRGVLRGVFRTRHLESVGRDEPLRLWRRADGELVLSDAATGHEVELRSFGHTNHGSFAEILAAAEVER